MRIAAIFGYPKDISSHDFLRLREGIIGCGHEFILLSDGDSIPEGVSMLLCLGGDGTYLRGARMAAQADIPVLGVNFGRLGFLSENTVDATLDAFRKNDFHQKDRAMLSALTSSGEYLAVNEVTVRRSGPAMLGVTVAIDGVELPAYWGDGLVVATAAGSTAYNLSVGGPIVFPSSKVLIIAPIAPHNLNVRPLVIPSNRVVTLNFTSRDGGICFSADDQSLVLDNNDTVTISLAQFSLKRVSLGESGFVKALCDKLSWGEDIRNER